MTNDKWLYLALLISLGLFCYYVGILIGLKFGGVF